MPSPTSAFQLPASTNGVDFWGPPDRQGGGGASRGHPHVGGTLSQHWHAGLALLSMSARASRLRLEEELRRIVEQEEALDGEVKQLLQVDSHVRFVPHCATAVLFYGCLQ